MDTTVESLIEKVRARRLLPAASIRREIRQTAGVSLRDVATAVGVSHAAVRSWEQGARPRDPEHLQAYARLLRELASP